MKSYLVYWLRMVRCALVAKNKIYYLWIALLGFLSICGVVAYSRQISEGLIVTNMTDQVSWGAYIANFSFLVGLGAAAVLLVFPAFILRRSEVREVVLLGELLAFCTITASLLFVVVDLGRPDRFLHLLPGIGRLNFPRSMLTWDVLVLNGYLLLNLHIPGYLLYKRYQNQKPNPWVYMPFVLLSIAWAISIHTVAAFLYSGLGGRPYWNTAILAPRFLISAFAGAPALLMIVFGVIYRFTSFKFSPAVFDLLKKLLRIFLPINMFLMGCEIFTEFYTDTLHVESAKYLLFGLDGHNMLVPYIWTSIAITTAAMFMIFIPKLANHWFTLGLACVFTVIGLWIEKGMGVIIPGFIPTPLGDLVEYTPSVVEFFVCLGIWAFGALMLTVFMKVATAILSGELRETDDGQSGAGSGVRTFAKT